MLNSGAHTITATHDLHFMLRTKLAATWQHRQTLKITGEVWELMGGEWRVRVGRIMKEGGGQGLPVKGVVVEVEWVGGETMVESVLKGVGEEVVGLKDGRWVCGADGEPGGVEQVGRVWAEVLRFR